jgi:hypothetical protein
MNRRSYKGVELVTISAEYPSQDHGAATGRRGSHAFEQTGQATPGRIRSTDGTRLVGAAAAVLMRLGLLFTLHYVEPVDCH